MSESDHHSEQSLSEKSDLSNLKLVMNQSIEQISQQCQHQIQENLEQIWIAAEKERASLAQRMVSDHLAMVNEGTSSLPNYHPLHWFQSQLEFKLCGVLEFSNAQTAQHITQDILNQLQSEISLLIDRQQQEIAREFDRQIQNIRKSLATTIQPQLQNRRVIVAEYVNSYVSLAKLQLREVDKFGFFLNGQRVSSSNIVISDTTIASPWYLLGLQKKQQPVYRVMLQQLKSLVKESLERTFRDVQTQIASYIETDLHQQIQDLLSSV